MTTTTMTISLQDIHYYGIILSSSNNNNNNKNSTQLPFAINWEQFPIGVVYLSLAFVAFIWLLSLRGIFKNQILLQRQLFAFILLNFLSRGITQGILHQFCFRSQQPNNRPGHCYYIDRFSMTFDLLSSAFNFTIYSILVSFWAEKYYGMKRERGGLNSLFLHPEDFSLERIRHRINILFWIFQLFAYGLVTVLIALVWAIPDNKFYYTTPAYQYSRMSARIVLSLGICLGLVIYGLRVYKYFKIRFNTQRNISKVAYITLYCGSCYFFLVVSNIVTTPLYESYGEFEYSWIFFNVFGALEISANLVLLLVLTPRSILNLVGKLLFCKRRRSNSTMFINSDIISADNKYIDFEYDYKPTPFAQTYLDNYEYSDEESDSDDEYTQSIFEDSKYYSAE